MLTLIGPALLLFSLSMPAGATEPVYTAVIIDRGEYWVGGVRANEPIAGRGGGKVSNDNAGEDLMKREDSTGLALAYEFARRGRAELGLGLDPNAATAWARAIVARRESEAAVRFELATYRRVFVSRASKVLRGSDHDAKDLAKVRRWALNLAALDLEEPIRRDHSGETFRRVIDLIHQTWRNEGVVGELTEAEWLALDLVETQTDLGLIKFILLEYQGALHFARAAAHDPGLALAEAEALRFARDIYVRRGVRIADEIGAIRTLRAELIQPRELGGRFGLAMHEALARARARAARLGFGAPVESPPATSAGASEDARASSRWRRCVDALFGKTPAARD